MISVGSKGKFKFVFVFNFEALSACSRSPVDPHSILTDALGNVVNDVVFGRTWDADDPTWMWLRRLQDEGTRLIGVAGPLNFLPFLR